MILDKIREGESKTVEFKELMPQRNQLVKTVCSFANRAGGYIFLGVDDEGRVKGIDSIKMEEYLESIPNMIHDSIFPMIIPEIYSYNIDGKILVVVQVYPGSSTPYYIKQKGKLQGTYIRVGRTNKLADNETIQELERKRLNKSYDEDFCRETSEADVERLKRVLGDIFDKEITNNKLYDLRLLEKSGDTSYMTNGACIILGEMENLNLKCARFKGDSVMNFIDRKEFSGSFMERMGGALAFIRSHINYSSIIDGSSMKRRDVQEIPDTVVREAVINALIHRDYSISGSDIKIAVYDDRIEVISPGGLPKTITVEEIYAGRSEIRNKVLASVFLKAGIIEQWGSGIPRMREACREHGLREPEIFEDGMFVKLVVYRKLAKYDFVREESDTAYSRVMSKSRKIEREKDEIVELVRMDGFITAADVSRTLNITVSSARRRLLALQEEKRIRRVGSKKTGHWEIYERWTQ